MQTWLLLSPDLISQKNDSNRFYSCGVKKAKNSKHEIRNTKQFKNPNDPMTKTIFIWRISSRNFLQGINYAAVVLNFEFWSFEFVSNFVLSISDLFH